MLSLSIMNLPSSLTVDAGAPLPLAINTNDSGAVSFSYSSSNANLLTATDETSSTNVVQISVTTNTNAAATGTMTFQLYGNDSDVAPAVDQIESLIKNDFYNSTSPGTTDAKQEFFRVIAPTAQNPTGIIQGGSPNNTDSYSGGTTFDDYFDPNLRFTTGGILALANSGPNTNSSQFFITTTAARQYDFNYTIIGFLTSGNSVLQAIDAVQVEDNSQGEDSEPVKAVVINSISTYSDTQDGEVLLSAPLGTANNTPVNLTVKATDASGNTTSQTIPVTIVTDPYPPEFTRPFLGASAAAVGTSSAAFTYQIPTATGGTGTTTDGETVAYGATVPSQYANDFSISTFSWNGLVTITPLRNFSGVASMTVGAAYSQGLAEAGLDADVQVVPIDVSVPAFLLASPTPGTVTAGTNVTIQWTAGNVDAAGPSKISLGYDSDSTGFDANQKWIEVDGVTAANGSASYTWNTTSVAAGTYYLDGYMYDDSTSKAVYSNIGASIVILPLPVPAFTLAGPTAGTFTAGQSVNIQWTAADVDVAGPTKISLGYDRDSTAFDANQKWLEVDQVTAANGAASYAWNTTNVAAGTYYLSGYMYDFSTSKAVYSHLGTSIVIVPAPPAAFALTGPTAGTFTAGQSVTIGWTATNVDVAGPSKISLGYDPDSTAFDANQKWIEVDGVIAANGAAAYSWNTTGVAAGTYYLSGYMYDFSTSKGVYSHLGTSIVLLGPPAFTLTGPTAGTFTAGQSVTIQWSATNVDVAGPSKISLGYDPDSTAFDANQKWIEVDGVIAANGAASYSWNTSDVASGTYYLSGYMYDFSTSKEVLSHLGASIVITGGAPPAFTLTGPTAGTFTAGTSVTIQWSASDVDVAGPTKISLDYDADTAIDGNATWIEVDQVTAANGAGSYSWNTTNVAAGTYYLGGYMFDFSTSKAHFSVVSPPIVIAAAPTFVITSPSTGTFTAGTSVTIQWTAANVDVAGPTTISLVYDPDATALDSNQVSIATGITAANGSGSYAWNTSAVAPGTYYLAGYMYDATLSQQYDSIVATPIVID
jgi:cyclophilin family peptidyl-prolyl cis-trans isomerase